MQRNYTFLACVYGLFVVTMRCITYVAVYNMKKRKDLLVIIRFHHFLLNFYYSVSSMSLW
jgi:hypothetical protein